MTLIPPYDHPDVIAGQGTAAKELIEEVGAARRAVRLPRRRRPALRLGARGARARAGVQGLRRRARGRQRRPAVVPQRRASSHIETPRTIADGAQTLHLGELHVRDHPPRRRRRADRDRRRAGRGDALLRRAHEDGRRADRLPRLRRGAAHGGPRSRASASASSSAAATSTWRGSPSWSREPRLLATGAPSRRRRPARRSRRMLSIAAMSARARPTRRRDACFCSAHLRVERAVACRRRAQRRLPMRRIEGPAGGRSGRLAAIASSLKPSGSCVPRTAIRALRRRTRIRRPAATFGASAGSRRVLPSAKRVT